MNPSRLFLASCVALVATAMSFAIRGDIMGDFERVFGLSATEVGWIAGAAFWGFGLSMLVGGPLCDALGMRTLARLAGAGHIAGTFLTIVAPNFAALFAATLIVGIANGLVEAFVNPLIATLFAKDKTSKLVALHAWFPGGIVIGGLLAFAFTQIGLGWQAKMLLLVVPTAAYAWLFHGAAFPTTESKAAGVSTGGMFAEIGRPMFLLVWLCMWLTAATELGPGQWVANIFNEVMQSGSQVGIILLVWVNGIMYGMRQFFGHLPHRLSPTLLIAVTAPVAALGLYLFGQAATPFTWFLSAALLAMGTAFWWPTMLGITSERFPRGGALLLAIIGASGSVATALSGPIMGWLNDTYGARAVLPMWSTLPVALTVIFVLIHLGDRARGGYRVESIGRVATSLIAVFVIGLLAGGVLDAQAPGATPNAPGQAAPPSPAGQGRGGFVPYPRRAVDAEAAKRGEATYSVNCAFCHGRDGRGGDSGPSLLRAQLVLDDKDGDLIGPVLASGRPPRMPSFTLTREQVADLAAFIHAFEVSSAGRRPPANIVVGDRARGEAAFKARCASCHSATGDLAGVATRFPDPVTLQQTWLLPGSFGPRGGGPPRPAPPVRAVVATPSGERMEGTLDRIDDFGVSLRLADGTHRTFRTIGTGVKVELDDPLRGHKTMLASYSDPEIHDITAYLVTLQ
jgi:mono/diheme cytochrome c family protein/predicted MFS family arabinose efflux permease